MATHRPQTTLGANFLRGMKRQHRFSLRRKVIKAKRSLSWSTFHPSTMFIAETFIIHFTEIFLLVHYIRYNVFISHVWKRLHLKNSWSSTRQTTHSIVWNTKFKYEYFNVPLHVQGVQQWFDPQGNPKGPLGSWWVVATSKSGLRLGGSLWSLIPKAFTTKNWRGWRMLECQQI